MVEFKLHEKLKVDVVNQFVNAFDINFYKDEEDIQKLFSNQKLSENLIRERINMLNSIYHTHLWKEEIISITEFLYKKGNREKFENRIIKRDTNVVREIAYQGGKGRSCFSFYTKYCCLINPKSYPIYDSFVDIALNNFNSESHFYKEGKIDFEKIRKECDYKTFIGIIDDFIENYNLTECTYREIDKFLWLVGKNI